MMNTVKEEDRVSMWIDGQTYAGTVTQYPASDGENGYDPSHAYVTWDVGGVERVGLFALSPAPNTRLSA